MSVQKDMKTRNRGNYSEVVSARGMLFGIYLEDTWKHVDGNHNHYGEKDWVYTELPAVKGLLGCMGCVAGPLGPPSGVTLSRTQSNTPKHCFLEASKGHCAQSLKKMLMTYQSQHPTASPGIPKML